MLNNFLHFLKYNNATVIILAVILILGGGALAAGPEAIGQKKTSVQGIDNTALLAADFSNFNMDFKIENLEQDEKYYYATYSYLDLVQRDGAWQYQLSQKTQKISQKIKEDLGVYMAKFLAKHYQARTRQLKEEKILAESQGEQRRIEVTEYSGLIGRALDLAAAVFPGYEPVVKRELPAPAFADALAGRPDLNLPILSENIAGAPPASGADNLTRIYNEYVAEHPEIFNPPANESGQSGESAEAEEPAPEQAETSAESTPNSADPAAAADSEIAEISETSAEANSSAESGADGSPPAIPEPATVDIIELPVPPSASSGQAAPEPVVTPETAPLEPAPVQ